MGTRSIYGDIATSLDSACRSMQTANAMLVESCSVLRSKTYDLPRIASATRNIKCYELVGETEVRAAQYHLTSDIEPQIRDLIERAEEGLMRMQKREAGLRAQAAPASFGHDSSPSEEDAQAIKAQMTTLGKEKESLVRELKKLDAEVKKKKAILAGLERK